MRTLALLSPVALSFVVACGEAPGARSAPPSDGEVGQEGDDRAIPASSAPAGDGSPRALLSEIDRELGHMRSSAYVHRTSIDEASGTFEFDCSGFVGYALSRAAPAAWEELRGARSRTGRPLAKDFEGFFESLPGAPAHARWRHVARVSDLEPGDVVAWLRPADVSSRSTGHVVVVHGPVTPFEGRPGAFLVPVADSTSVLHGAGDSRQSAQTTGLGTGTLILLVDDRGAPVGYRWSLGSRAVDHSCRIAMGRLSTE